MLVAADNFDLDKSFSNINKQCSSLHDFPLWNNKNIMQKSFLTLFPQKY